MGTSTNPQNLKPFKPGQTGNPNGRPKKLPALDTLLADVLGENGEHAKEILQALLKKAIKGDVRAAEVLFDRGYGKAKQEINQKNTIEDNRVDESLLSDEELQFLSDLQRRCGPSKT